MSGRVIWITGLSGSGKTILAKHVEAKLKTYQLKPIILDGDTIREALELEDPAYYDEEKRLNIAFQYSKICKILSSQGFIVIIATISMFKEIYNWNRENLPGYFEVYLKVPIEELIRRDSKRIYSKLSQGQIKNVAGLDLKIDEPTNADIVFNFNPRKSVDELAEALVGKANLNSL